MAHPICSQKPGEFYCFSFKLLLPKVVRDQFIAPVPETERGDLILAYHKLLNSVDEVTRLEAARAWFRWEYVSLAVCDWDIQLLIFDGAGCSPLCYMLILPKLRR